MKRNLSLAFVVLGFAVTVAWLLWHNSSLAQGPLALLDYKGVQKELKLSDGEISKIKELSQKQKEIFQEFTSKPGYDQEGFKKKIKEIITAVHELLNPEQFKRLEQLTMQQAGPAVFITPLVVRKVELSDEQKSKIEKIYKQSSKECYALYRKTETGKLAELDTRVTAEIMENLNDDQKNKLKELVGEPYKGKMPPPSFFPF